MTLNSVSIGEFRHRRSINCGRDFLILEELRHRILSVSKNVCLRSNRYDMIHLSATSPMPKLSVRQCRTINYVDAADMPSATNIVVSPWSIVRWQKINRRKYLTRDDVHKRIWTRMNFGDPTRWWRSLTNASLSIIFIYLHSLSVGSW